MSSVSPSKVIVLTGASGYLGQHCLRGLMEHGYDDMKDDNTVTLNQTTQADVKVDKEEDKPTESLIIYALVHQSSNKTELRDAISSYYDSRDETIKKHFEKNVTVINVALDLTSSAACDEWFATLRRPLASSAITIDCCIHTAALSSPAICQQNPERAMSINVPTYFIQNLFRNNPNIAIIALSTDQVYDGNISAGESNDTNSRSSNFYNESSKCEPCNVYGTSKVELETYLIQQQKLHYPQASVILLRSSIISQSVIAVSDVVRVIVVMMSHYSAIAAKATTDQNGAGCSEIYCMGGPSPLNRYDMAKAVLSHFAVIDPSNEIAVPILKGSAPNSTTGSGIVKSPLNISMDSRKLLQFMRETAVSIKKDHHTSFISLTDIVIQTFSDLQMEKIA